jgi:hypothetical protein
VEWDRGPGDHRGSACAAHGRHWPVISPGESRIEDQDLTRKRHGQSIGAHLADHRPPCAALLYMAFHLTSPSL